MIVANPKRRSVGALPRRAYRPSRTSGVSKQIGVGASVGKRENGYVCFYVVEQKPVVFEYHAVPNLLLKSITTMK